MDVRKIALYLSWRLPPHYGNSQKLFFIRQLKDLAKEYYTNEELTFIDQQTRQDDEKFFIEILEDQKRTSEDNFNNLIEKLNLPPEVIDSNLGKIIENWKWDYTWNDFEMKITETYWKNPSNIDKWELFWKLSTDILEKIGKFINVHSVWAWSDGWIDLTASNIIRLGDNTQIEFWWFWQCKYKEKWNVPWTDISRLVQTISDDVGWMYQFVYFFTNKDYVPWARKSLEAINHNNSNRKCFWFNGDNLLDIINSHKEIYIKYLPTKRSLK